MKIKNLLILSGILVITSCVVSKKKYSELEMENAKLKKDIADAKANKINMANQTSKISYSLGVNVASSVKSQGVETAITAFTSCGKLRSSPTYFKAIFAPKLMPLM